MGWEYATVERGVEAGKVGVGSDMGCFDCKGEGRFGPRAVSKGAQLSALSSQLSVTDVGPRFGSIPSDRPRMRVAERKLHQQKTDARSAVCYCRC